MEWREKAACKDPSVDRSIFFPARGQSDKPAKRVCALCPVRSECLSFALENGEQHGIWGGKSENQRRVLRRTVPVHCVECGVAMRYRSRSYCGECATERRRRMDREKAARYRLGKAS